MIQFVLESVFPEVFKRFQPDQSHSAIRAIRAIRKTGVIVIQRVNVVVLVVVCYSILSEGYHTQGCYLGLFGLLSRVIRVITVQVRIIRYLFWPCLVSRGC